MNSRDTAVQSFDLSEQAVYFEYVENKTIIIKEVIQTTKICP